MYGVYCALALAACGDNQHVAPPDAAGPDAFHGFREAPHPMAPQLVLGAGTTLAAPVVVPIFFTGDDAAQAQLEAFLAQLAADPVYWPTTTSEYGVGPLTVRPSVVLSAMPPTTDAALQTLLAQNVGVGQPLGALDPQAIYTVFLPQGVVLTSGGVSCKAFEGYHSEIVGSGAAAGLVYALLPRCGGPLATFPQPLDMVTMATSHELVEAVTDPHFFTAPGYNALDANDLVMGRFPGAETGDLCEDLATAPARIVGSFMVQRTWSNASAAAGHDPCVPAPATPYAAAAPVLVEDVPIGRSGTLTKGVTVPFQSSATIEVDLFSDRELPVDFDVAAYDVLSLQGSAPQLNFEWNAFHGNNGDKLSLIITRSIAGSGRGSEFVIITTIKGRQVGMWWGFAAD
jgi:hypothetical protein